MYYLFGMGKLSDMCGNYLGGHNCTIVYETPILVQSISGIFPPF